MVTQERQGLRSAEGDRRHFLQSTQVQYGRARTTVRGSCLDCHATVTVHLLGVVTRGAVEQAERIHVEQVKADDAAWNSRPHFAAAGGVA